jgi:hypothetical protein
LLTNVGLEPTTIDYDGRDIEVQSTQERQPTTAGPALQLAAASFVVEVTVVTSKASVTDARSFSV